MAHTQVAISFDTTGSMSAALDEVRKRITEMIQRLKRDIPDVTVSVIAHGDYRDADIYVTKHVDFTDDEYKLSRFVRDVKPTRGGAPWACYELVLRLARTQLSWRWKASRILIVIGDAYPRLASDPLNKDNIDWKQEARLLAAMVWFTQTGKTVIYFTYLCMVYTRRQNSHLNYVHLSHPLSAFVFTKLLSYYVHSFIINFKRNVICFR
jgi:hypothetical protein